MACVVRVLSSPNSLTSVPIIFLLVEVAVDFMYAVDFVASEI